jgi:hypothetical protein
VDAQHAIQAMSAPAVFVSAGGLLLLSLNARLSAVFGRVRGLQHTDEGAESHRLVQALVRRARRLRNAFVFALLGVAACLTSCLLLAGGAFWHPMSVVGFVALLAGVVALLGSVGCYLAEVLLALPSLELGHGHVPSGHPGPAHPSRPARPDAA